MDPSSVDSHDAVNGQHSLAELPDAVRTRIVQWAAQSLDRLPSAQVPASLIRVARFTPAKRARLGAAGLIQAVGDDTAFRALVAETARRTAAVDPVGAAAQAFLLQAPDRDELLERAGQSEDLAGLRAELTDAAKEIERLRTRLDATEAELSDLRRSTADAVASADLDKLRGRLREQGVRLRAAEQAADAARSDSAERISALEAETQTARQAADEWRRRAEQAAERADQAAKSLAVQRESAVRDRAAESRRIELLLETTERAAAGLRREWNLTGGGPLPADAVATDLPGDVRPGERAGDPARLADWLGLPLVHLIVDGYNVTKQGYPELSLADQRDRLIRGLAALAARMSAEVTVVFDGAAVAVPQPPGRGIRVLFSPPGVIADDVIRRLVAAEPPGRQVVVVTSDAEIIRDVSRIGARTAGSSVLLGMFAR